MTTRYATWIDLPSSRSAQFNLSQYSTPQTRLTTITMMAAVGCYSHCRSHRLNPLNGCGSGLAQISSKRIDLTNITEFDGLHSLLLYSYRCVPVAFESATR